MTSTKNESIMPMADSGSFYLSRGITHINGVSITQNSLLGEQNQQE